MKNKTNKKIINNKPLLRVGFRYYVHFLDLIQYDNIKCNNKDDKLKKFGEKLAEVEERILNLENCVQVCTHFQAYAVFQYSTRKYDSLIKTINKNVKEVESICNSVFLK